MKIGKYMGRSVNQEIVRERRKNEWPKRSYEKKSVVRFIKGARPEWAGRVRRVANTIAKTVLVNNTNEKRPRGPPEQRRSRVVKKRNNVFVIRMDLNRARGEQNRSSLGVKGTDGL